MRTPPASPIIDAMPTEAREIRLIVSIDLDGDPIAGTLESRDGRSGGFAGWIGLAAMLNTIRSAEAGGPDHRAARTDKDT